MKKLFFLAVLTALVFTATGFVPHTVLGKTQKFFAKDNAIPNRYIVVLNEEKLGFDMSAPTVESDAQYLANIYGGSVEMTYSSALKGFVTEMSEKEARSMSDDDNVLYVEQDSTIAIESTQTGAQWNLDRVDQRNMPWDGNY